MEIAKAALARNRRFLELLLATAVRAHLPPR
jgi:hypothetical protein